MLAIGLPGVDSRLTVLVAIWGHFRECAGLDNQSLMVSERLIAGCYG